MPRQDRTYSDQDVIRIFERHLSEEEADRVLKFFQISPPVSRIEFEVWEHIKDSHGLSVNDAAIVLGILENILEDIDRIFKDVLPDVPEEDVLNVVDQHRRGLESTLNQFENLTRQVPRIQFLSPVLAGGIGAAITLLAAIWTVLNALDSLRRLEKPVEEIRRDLFHLVDDLASLGAETRQAAQVLE